MKLTLQIGIHDFVDGEKASHSNCKGQKRLNEDEYVHVGEVKNSNK